MTSTMRKAASGNDFQDEKSERTGRVFTRRKSGARDFMKKRTIEILHIFDEMYGTDVFCHLHYHTPEQLLIATMLSAQCTDARVNIVTKTLFRKYPDMEAFSRADLPELEQDIHSVGFYHSKARNIIACAKKICAEYGGRVPDTIEELTSLAGVGRKTANLILGQVFHKPCVVVDTHVKRISKRLGFTKETDPVKVERDLMKELPEDHWIRYNTQAVSFGREICSARSPGCGSCRLAVYCVETHKEETKPASNTVHNTG